MNYNQQRVFVFGSLMRNLHNLHKMEPDTFLGQATLTPLYVLLHAQVTEREMNTEWFDFTDQSDLYELGEEDTELIGLLETHPEFFSRRLIQLEDGTEAVAYGLAQQQLYTIQRVTDEADWLTVMRTFDPVWMVGPYIPQKKKNKR